MCHNEIPDHNKIKDYKCLDVINNETNIKTQQNLNNLQINKWTQLNNKTDECIVTTSNLASLNIKSNPSVKMEVIGSINNNQFIFIIDTGASASIININNLPTGTKLKSMDNIKLITANGTNLNFMGIIDTIIKFKNINFPIQCMVVKNLVGPNLLGIDFLKLYKAKIDFVKKQIKLLNDDKSVTLEFGNENKISNNNIKNKIKKITVYDKDINTNKNKNNTSNNVELYKKLINKINNPISKWWDNENQNELMYNYDINKLQAFDNKLNINNQIVKNNYDKFNKSITLLASKCVKLDDVAKDGNCGIYTLQKILQNEKIIINYQNIKDLLKLSNNKKPIWLESEDLVAVVNHFGFNLIILQEIDNSNYAALAFYKTTTRKFLCIFHNLNHWSPGVISNKINNNITDTIHINDIPTLKSRQTILESRYKEEDLQDNKNTYNITNIMHQNNSPIINKMKLEKISPDDIKENFDINPELSIEQKNKLIKLLHKYNNVFSQSKCDLGEVNTDPIEIKLSDNTPVNLRNFKLSRSEINEIEKQTKELLETGIIEHSISSYSSPVFLVPKGQPQGTKNKSPSEYRMVLDYRRINEKTLKEVFPLPIIQNIYDSLAGNKYFSSLDAMSGFHQLKLHKNSKEITSFSTSTGHYQFTRLPFGLTNAPQNFQKVMNKIMAGLNYRINCCYLDDCVCFGKTFDDHLNSLELTFERLLKYNLKLKISKCKFGYTELKILGNIINTQGIKPTEEGLLAIRNFSSPSTIKQLRSFLGLANYFRRFIPNFSKLAHPLTELTKGKFKTKISPITWNETHEIAFKNLKDKLTNKPVLSHFDENAEIILVTDGSKKGLGVILQQQNENKEIHPVSFASKKLNKAQNNYSALELEMSALYFGCTHFRQYLHGRQFTVWTDHKNLVQLQTIKSESPILNRLRTKLIGFDFKIIFKKGIFNQAADFLSRNPINLNNTINNTEKNKPYNINIVEPINIKILQTKDNYLKNIITALENTEIMDAKWQNIAKSYILNKNDELLYYKEIINGSPKLVLAVPEILTKEIIQNFHDNKMVGAHLGVHKVYNKIRSRYHWPLMHKQIKTYVTSCIICQKRKPDKTKQVGKMQTYPIKNGAPFSDITIDYVGPLIPSHGFKYILVATCRITKYCVAKPCRNADARTTTQFLLNLILTYGAMRTVRSDNGTHFTAKVISDILTALNIKKTEGIAYRPTSQGNVEKQNQVIIDMIAPYMNDKEKWTDILQIVLHAYNSTIHFSTGYSPFYLLHGYEPKSIFDIVLIPNTYEHSVIDELNKLQKVRDTIPQILQKAFKNQKDSRDKNKYDIDYKVGEKVLVKIPIRKNKFSNRYDGPYSIIKKLNQNTYLIKINKNNRLVDVPIHVQQIKKFIDKSHQTHNIFYFS